MAQTTAKGSSRSLFHQDQLTLPAGWSPLRLCALRNMFSAGRGPDACSHSGARHDGRNSHVADTSVNVRGMRKRVPGEFETVVVGFTDHYGRLMGKRYDAEMFVDSIAGDGAHGGDDTLQT